MKPFGPRFVLPIALGNTLNPVNSTMIAVALVPIARDFDATVAQTGWLIAGLYLASAVAQPTMGRYSSLPSLTQRCHTDAFNAVRVCLRVNVTPCRRA